jgi:hypothetical protein
MNYKKELINLINKTSNDKLLNVQYSIEFLLNELNILYLEEINK